MSEKELNLIVGMTGASGAILCVKLLETLQPTRIRTHLVMTKWGMQTLRHETGMESAEIRRLADHTHSDAELGATMSSGSSPTIGMVIVPCSMKTLGAIASGSGPGLIHRAADVTLKERRRLVLVVREAPLNDIHIENMLRVSRAGAVIFPPVPAFYAKPQSVDDIVSHLVSRILDQFGALHTKSVEWRGLETGGE